MADTDELQKQIVTVPNLPNVIQGDGRYLMSLLKSYLETSNAQINLANGFTAEDLKEDTEGAVPTPKHFTLVFDRLGGTFSWDHLIDLSNLAYYELRTDTNVGQSNGLIDRTMDNQSFKLPANYVDTVYLYSVYKNMEYSKPSVLTYTKPRPEAPSDIALTKNNEGTLITFLEIPSNCIGANIYIDGYKYSTIDNLYLFKHEVDYRIEKVEVAYYDSFGEGERGVLYCILPNITNFLVERNGSNLDFYWDALNIYGVQYSVRVNQVPVWDSGMEIFRTKLNKKSYIYPNTGTHYFLIKAIDEHNNTSDVASYYMLDHKEEIDKNVILNYKQIDSAYNGNKINCYYDAVAQGLRLEKKALSAEYIMSVNLPQEYKARNWLNMDVQGVSSNDITWDECDFMWGSEEAENLAWGGKISDLTGVVVEKQIALSDDVISALALITLDNTLTAETGQVPFESVGSDTFATGRWAQGLFVKDTTRLAYNVDGTKQFNLVFWLKKNEALNDTVFMTIADSSNNGLYEVGYRESDNSFYLLGADGKEVTINARTQERDWIMIGISQGPSLRSLFVKSVGFNSTESNSADALPMGTVGKMYCYPKILI